MNRVRVVTVIVGALLVLGGCDLTDDIGQKKVKYFLKDSKSAEFRNSKKSASYAGEVFCGEVNSKNSYGGLSGFKKYVVIRRLVLMEDGSTGIYDLVEDSEKALGSSFVESSMGIAKSELLNLEVEASNNKLMQENDAMRARIEEMRGTHKFVTRSTGAATAFYVAWDKNCK